MSSLPQSYDNNEPTSILSLSFDKPFVDVVLRSADGFEFHALQQCLIDASPVLSDMFSIPQPPNARTEEKIAGEAGEDNASVSKEAQVDLAETGDTLRALVHIFHPFAPLPTFSSFDDFKAVMRAWVKYDLHGQAKKRAQAALEPFLFAEPLRVYAFAAQLQEPELTKAAARACLRLADVWSPDAVELDDISARTYRRLLVYRDACVATIGCLEQLDLKVCREIFGAEWTWVAQCQASYGHPRSSRDFFGDRLPTSRKILDHELLAKLRATPHLEVLKQDDALDFVWKDILECKCRTCAQKTHRQLPHYRAALITEIGRRLSEVPF